VREAIGVTPGRILVVPPRSIPLTHNGKIRYALLRERVTSGQLVERAA
jgi:hypothetical protein